MPSKIVHFKGQRPKSEDLKRFLYTIFNDHKKGIEGLATSGDKPAQDHAIWHEGTLQFTDLHIITNDHDNDTLSGKMDAKIHWSVQFGCRDVNQNADEDVLYTFNINFSKNTIDVSYEPYMHKDMSGE